MIISYLNREKGGFYSTDPAELTWHAGPARMRRGTEATWQGRAWPTRGAGGADTWREAMQVHADARKRCQMARGASNWRAHGLVGLGYRIGAVMQ